MNEMLARSAPYGLARARELCTHNPAGDCSWYHGPWQYFRLLGVVSTAAVHETFFVERLRALLQDGRHRRILISGSTDYAMLAMVLAASGERSVDITVADICATPLALCEWYARERGIAIRTQAGNILDLPVDEPYDAICTHAFMGYFDDAERARLVRQWHALLRPGGSVITVQRLRPGHPPGLARFSPAQAAAFQAQVLAEATARQADLDIAPEQLAAYGAGFAEHFVSHPIRTRDELPGLFLAAGFALPVFELHDIGQATPGTLSGPSVPAQAQYAHIVATR